MYPRSRDIFGRLVIICSMCGPQDINANKP